MAKKNWRTSKKIVAFNKDFFRPARRAADPILAAFREYILAAFREHPNVEMVPIQELGNARPDIIINFVSFSPDHDVEIPLLKRSSAVYVVCTGEAMLMRPRIYDWAFSYDSTTRYNFRLGGIARVLYPLLEPKLCEKYSFDFPDSIAKHGDKTKFCHFIYTNPYAVERIIFTKKLMQYKEVDCLGTVLNNGPKLPRNDIRSEINVTKDYKFGIAFENHSRTHYTTEKIFKCFMAGVVPIYWGNPKVSELINPEAFINCHDYENFDAVVKHVMEVDNDPELYARYLNAPPILPESPLRRSGPEFLKRRVEQIIDSVGKIRPIATYPTYQLRHRIWRKMNGCYVGINILSRGVYGKSLLASLIAYLAVAKRLWRIYRASGRFSM